MSSYRWGIKHTVLIKLIKNPSLPWYASFLPVGSFTLFSDMYRLNSLFLPLFNLQPKTDQHLWRLLVMWTIFKYRLSEGVLLIRKNDFKVYSPTFRRWKQWHSLHLALGAKMGECCGESTQQNSVWKIHCHCEHLCISGGNQNRLGSHPHLEAAMIVIAS